MEDVYSVELRHQEDPADSSGGEHEEGTLGEKFHGARDWLCVWLGAEHSCVNVSRRLGDRGMGEVHARLSHSFHLLSATGDHFFTHNMLNFIRYNLSWSLSVLLSCGYRCTCQQQCPGEMGAGWRSTVGPGRAAGWT